MNDVIFTPGLSDELTVRRHLDLTKYLDMLSSKSMYLRRSDRFADRLEGVLTPSIRHAIDEIHRENNDHESADQFQLRSRTGSLVSCWSLGIADNMALWQLYGGASTSVAVVTNIKSLILAVSEWPDPTYIFKVEYIDQMSDPDMIVGHYTDMLQYKHVAYEFEQELRVVASRHRGNWQNTPEGARFRIPDLNSFVQEVIVAPEAPDWYVDLIADVSLKYGLTATIRKSDLATIKV